MCDVTTYVPYPLLVVKMFTGGASAKSILKDAPPLRRGRRKYGVVKWRRPRETSINHRGPFLFERETRKVLGFFEGLV